MKKTNPVVMSFVPSGDTQDIIASGDELATMIADRTGLTIEANVGTDFAAVHEAMGAEQAHIGWQTRLITYSPTRSLTSTLVW